MIKTILFLTHSDQKYLKIRKGMKLDRKKCFKGRLYVLIKRGS